MGFALSMMQIVFVNAQTLDTRLKAPVAKKFAGFEVIKDSPDGKIVVGGDFNYYGNQEVGQLIRLTAAGAVDPTFKAPEWLPHPQFIEFFSNGDILSVVDGSENQPSFIRLSGRNGSYITGKETGVPYNITDVLVLPDNSIIVTSLGRVVKFTKDLLVDPNFKINNMSFNGWVTGIDRQGTKFIVTGSFSHVGDVYKDDVIRLNTDGSIDNSFDAGSGTGGYINGVTVQPDNKILLNANLSSFNGNWICGLVRLNANGSVDESFESPNNPGNYITTAVRNSRIYVTTDNYVFRLLMDGTQDEAYSTVGFETESALFAVLKDGSFVTNGDSRAVVKYNAKGQQTTFKAPLAAAGSISSVNKFGKKFIVGGDFHYLNDASDAINYGYALVDEKGVVDKNFVWIYGNLPSEMLQLNDEVMLVKFDCCGLYLFTAGGFAGNYSYDHSYPLNVAVQTIKSAGNGKLLLATNNGVSRIFNNGERDNSFHLAEVGNNGNYADIELDENYKIIFGSRLYYYNGPVGGMVRLNSNGTIDYRYATGFGPNNSIQQLATLPGGEVVAYGNFNYWNDNVDISSDIRSLSSGPELLVEDDPGTYIPYGLVKIKKNGKIDTQFLQNTAALLSNRTIVKLFSFRNKILLHTYNYNNGTYEVIGINANGTQTADLLPRIITSVWDARGLSVLDNNTLVLTGLFQVKGQTGVVKFVKINYPNTIPVKAPPVEQEPIPDGRMASNSGFSVYPNPTSDFISLDTEHAANVSIFTLDGQIKINSKVSGAGDQIDIRGLKPGRYVVKISTDGKVRTEQFIVK
jgi:uncharacterized delta-60 repeat protein